MQPFNQTDQISGGRWVIRPAGECIEVWFWLTVILFLSLLTSGFIMSAFEPSLWGGPVRHQLSVQHEEPPTCIAREKGVVSMSTLS
jgi:hypothetical protein